MSIPHCTAKATALALALFFGAGCGGGSSPTGPTQNPVLTSISVSGGTTLAVGTTLSLVASPKDQKGGAIGATIAWSSSAASVATVSNTGLVTGIAAGAAVITAASGNISTTHSITVGSQVLTSITVSGGSDVQPGQSLQLVAAPRDQNGVAMTAALAWASDATNIATVSGSGLVTGVGVGTARITASFGGVQSAPKTITVSEPVFPSVANVNATAGSTFDPPSVEIARNGTVSWIFASLGHTMVFDAQTVGTPASIPNTTSNTTVSRTFNVAGTYNYHCTIHGGMTGTVIVH